MDKLHITPIALGFSLLSDLLLTRRNRTILKDNAMTTATATKPFRHPVQTFVWFRTEWDIAKMQEDIDAGRLKPSKITLEREFIEGYAEQVLALSKNRPIDNQCMSIIVSVSASTAVALPAAALDEPVIMLELTPGKGILTLDGHTTPDHILADGQHRIAKAYFEGTASINAFTLSRTQARRYKIS